MYTMFLLVDTLEIPIPVLPEKLKVSSPGKNQTATVLELGEVLQLRKRGLRSVEWESVFPAASGPYVTGTLPVPLNAVRAIQKARDSLKPLRFLLLGNDLDINASFGVDDFSYEERGGEPGDLYYSIKLTEWKNYAARRITLRGDGEQAATQEPARSGTPKAPASYTVVKGDSLWAVSKRCYGDGSQWSKLYAANKSAIGANPNLIYAGQVLKIP